MKLRSASVLAALPLAAVSLKRRQEADHPRQQVLDSFPHFLQYWKFKNRETGEILCFSDGLWAGQQGFLEAIELHSWVIALKAGKLGLTELECAFDGWQAWRHKNARVHIFSKNWKDAIDNLSYVRFGLTHLPAWMGVSLLEGEAGGDTVGSLKFRMGEDDERTIVSYAAGKHSSVSQTCMHCHADELARMPFPEDTWDAINSTIAPEGTCHIVSRGAGEDNHLAVLWGAAVEGMSDIFPFFADYRQRPGRDQGWRDNESGKMTVKGLRFFAPESPGDALSGEDMNDFIPIELWDACKEDLPPFRPDTLDRTPVILAVDAASTHDCFAVMAITRHPTRHGDVALRAARKWTPPKGGTIKYAGPESFIRAIVAGGCAAGHYQADGFRGEDVGEDEEGRCAACDEGILTPPYNVVVIVFDPYQLVDMMQSINRDLGVWTVPFDQISKRLKSDRLLYDLIIQKRIAHPGIMVVREHLQNAKAKLQKGEDSKLRMEKKAMNKKIDLAVTLSMGVYECLDWAL